MGLTLGQRKAVTKAIAARDLVGHEGGDAVEEHAYTLTVTDIKQLVVKAVTTRIRS